MVEVITEELAIRSYKAEDGVELYTRLGTKEDPSDIRQWAEEVEDGLVADTVVYEGQVVACAGITSVLKGVGQCWAVYSLDIGRYHIDPQIARNRIVAAMIKHNLRRVQATARIDYPAASSYLRYLGFEREGVMKMFEPDGTDAYLYAKTMTKECL